jgi:acyl carrier protein
MEDFIKNFKNQLDDITIDLSSDSDYASASYWDSLTAVTIQMMLEDEYGLKTDIKQISSFKSIKELFQFVQENK